ncbi:MAG: DUF5686 family protein [Bacteroidetes bacterium]|nr:DUF5686 family protein [Bacteroidota bacterium]
MKYCLIILLSLLFFFGSDVFSQEVFIVSGKVTDKANGRPLAFVNIVQEDGFGGTTDIDGKFRFRWTKKPRYLAMSYVGYESLNYPLTGSMQNLQIGMVAKQIDLKEVEVLPGINPAHRIIRNAIDNRDANDPEKLLSFSYTSYDKTFFTIDTDTTAGKAVVDTSMMKRFMMRADTTALRDSIIKKMADTSEAKTQAFFKSQYLFLMENVTKRKFLHPDKNYNKVIAARMSGFKDPIFVFLTTQIQSFSFYKPFITIFQSSYINPIGAGSLSRYFFKIEDTTYSGKDTTFIISFRPRKGTNFDGMKGIISISSNKWAIQNVIAEPAKQSGMEIRIQQMYELIDGEHWFPMQLNTDVTFYNLQAGRHFLIAKGRSYIRDIVLNPELVRREFTYLDVEVDQSAGARSEEFWNQYRMDSLSSKDRKTYKVLDSIGKASNLDKYAKSLQTILTGKWPWGPVDIDINRIINYNTYEGLVVGAGIHTNDKIARWFRVGGFYQYAFAVSTSKYGGDATFYINKRQDITLSGDYYYNLVPSGLVSFPLDYQSVLGGNFGPLYTLKLDRTQHFGMSFGFRGFKWFLFNIGLSNDFKKSTTWDFAIPEGNAVVLQDQFTFTEVKAGFKWAYKEQYIQTIDNRINLGTNYPLVWLEYTRGIKGFINGQYDYNKIDLKVKKTFNIKFLGKLTFQLNGGYVDQPVPACNLYYGDATYRMFALFAPNTFGTMRMNEFLSNTYASLFIYHDFGHLLLKGRKWFHPEFAVVQNIGFGWLDHKQNYAYQSQAPKEMNLGYYESGLLINNIVNLKLYTIGAGAFYRWGPYGFDNVGDNFAYKISVIFPF